MGKRILILVLVLSCSLFLRAQENTEYSTDTVVRIIEAPQAVDEDENYDERYEPVIDTTLSLRSIEITTDSINSWKKKPAFAYVRNLDSLLKASQQEAEPQPRPTYKPSFMTRLLGGPGIKFILWTLAIVFIGIILYQLLKSNGLFQKAPTSRVVENPDENMELLLHNDFDPLISQACNLGDYRLAVRYLFLKTLQQLRDKNQINYEPDKTNTRYVYELPEQRRNDFSRLIFQYEYVWYGHFEINKDQYDQVEAGFNNFYKKI